MQIASSLISLGLLFFLVPFPLVSHGFLAVGGGGFNCQAIGLARGEFMKSEATLNDQITSCGFIGAMSIAVSIILTV